MHPQNGMACVTLDRSSGKLLKMSDVFRVTNVAAALGPALEGLTREVSLGESHIEIASRPDASVCLTRIGVWLDFGLPFVVAVLDGISVPYGRLSKVLRPGIAPRSPRP